MGPALRRDSGPSRRSTLFASKKEGALPQWQDEHRRSNPRERWKPKRLRRRNRIVRTFAYPLFVALLFVVGWAAFHSHLSAQPETATQAQTNEEPIELKPRDMDISRVLRQDARPVAAQVPMGAPSPMPSPDDSESAATRENVDMTATSLYVPSETSTDSPADVERAVESASTIAPKADPTFRDDAILTPTDRAGLLSEIVFIPFEDAVESETIEGWEDDWFAEVSYDEAQSGFLPEPSIDFVYLWVNGSDDRFTKSKYQYELESPLNDADGTWISHHSVNRYRDWDELRYSIRSLEKYTGSWRNTIQLLVNSVPDEQGLLHKQTPSWLNDEADTYDRLKVVSQEELFDEDKQSCLPTFNSLTIENQIFNINSSSDNFVTLSDDMLLGKPHAASDFYSPLYGPMIGFKSNSYNTRNPPTDADAQRFGEKPYLIYTSWLLNRRFGQRKRKGQMHFGHSLRRSVMHEAMSSFPRPEMESACQRFRGEGKFQLYSWYAAFHYTVERHREVLLWSYLLHRADPDGNGYLDTTERERILSDLEAGMANEGQSAYRQRNFYHLAAHLELAGLEPPRLGSEVLWTSLDGPMAIHDLECSQFDVDECLAPGFGALTSERVNHTGPLRGRNPAFSTAAIFERIARAQPECGDCFLKLLLNQQPKGLGPLLPDAPHQAAARELVLKALKRYQYTVVDHDALFFMVTDAEQVESTLLKRFAKPERRVGQLCLNDDVASESPEDLDDVKRVMEKLYRMLLPHKSAYEV